MPQALPGYAQPVEDDKRDADVGEALMQRLDPVHPPEGIEAHHPAGGSEPGHCCQQRHDHGAAGGIVADETTLAAA